MRSSSKLSVVHALSAVALAASAGSAWGADATFPTGSLFDLSVNVGGNYNASTDSISGGKGTVSQGFSTVNQLFDSTKDAGFRQANADYTSNSASVVRLGYRGLPLVLQTTTGSNAVQLYIPSLGVQQSFNTKATRDDNLADAKDFLKKSGGDILNRLQQQLAKLSPVDPIAGNPASMQSRTVADDFDRNFTSHASNIRSSDGGSSNNLVGIGVAYGNYTAAGITSQVVTVPISYTFRSDLDPRRQLSVYAPITVVDTAGGKTIGVNTGVSYRLPMSDEWALTPALGYGVSGSADLGSAAAMLGLSLTSQYVKRFDSFDLAIGNMIGFYQSTRFTAGGYSFDPQIRNTVYRNGAMVSVPTSLMGQKMAAEFSFINTTFTGTDLYSKQYNEVGVTLGTNKGANSVRSYLRAGLVYLQGQNGVKGLRLQLGYWF